MCSFEEKYPELICNLSYEVMNDPVITNKGISYERNIILEWLKNNKICPITKAYLDETLLITNYCLKNLIIRLKTDENIKLTNIVNIDCEDYIKITNQDEKIINIINKKLYFTGIGEYYKNGELIYIGEIKKNIIDGEGKIFKKNKLKYEGKIKMNINKDINIDGYGIEYYKNNIIKYKGDFKKTVKEGTGTYYNYIGNKIYEGQFLNNKSHGHGTLYYYNNNVLKKKIKSTFNKGYIWNYKNNI